MSPTEFGMFQAFILYSQAKPTNLEVIVAHGRWSMTIALTMALGQCTRWAQGPALCWSRTTARQQTPKQNLPSLGNVFSRFSATFFIGFFHLGGQQKRLRKNPHKVFFRTKHIYIYIYHFSLSTLCRHLQLHLNKDPLLLHSS